MTVAEIDFNILAHAGHPLAKFAPGEIIFAAGDRGDKMYVIRSGEVEILIHHDKLVQVLSSGDIFGR